MGDALDGKKKFLLVFDLYWLRFEKPGDQWYELTDYLRDCLARDGVRVQYTKDDLIFNGISMKNILKQHAKRPRNNTKRIR